MQELTGTTALTRFVARRDRVRIAVWIAAVVALVWMSAASIEGLYPTPEDLRAAAVPVEDNPAVLAMNGPAQGLDTLGGRVAFETATFSYVLVALMSIFMIGRITRAEEESGRLELLRATVLGRHAPLAAALAVVVAMNVAIAAGVVLVLLPILPTTGSVLFGACFLAVGIAFTGVATATAQVTENTRVANGLAGAILGLSFLLRAAGDVSGGALSWASPIGWAQKAQPYVGDRWWPLLLLVALGAAALVAAVVLTSHRDLGAGLVQPRLGPERAVPGFDRPLDLALRLQRAGVLWWAFGAAVLGGVYGSVSDALEEFIGDNEAIADLFGTEGAESLTDAFFATTLLMIALVAGGFAVQATLRLRSEEAALRTEPLLATPVSRWRWMGSHLLFAFGGSVVVVVAGGLGLGIVSAAVAGEPGEVVRLTIASLAHVPAVWVLVGLATFLFGLVPRAVAVAWAALAVCVLVGFLGDLLGLPGWVRDVSPFEHLPRIPAADVAVLPLALLVAGAAALTLAGARGFRRRDIG